MIELDGRTAPGRLYLRGDRWWYANGGKRVSTGFTDETAAKLLALRWFDDSVYPQRSVELRERVRCAANVEQDPSSGWVYFIANASGQIKIGRARHFARRLSVLKSSNPGLLTPLGVARGGPIVEAALHERFAPLRVRGEWFTDCLELREFIALVCDPMHLIEVMA